MPHLAVHLLGPFHVTLDGEAVTSFESNKVRALLSYLMVEADRPHSRDELIGLLWPDQPDRGARRNLSQALFNLRQVIGDDTADPSFLHITRRSVQFNRASDYRLDVVEFESQIISSRQHEPEVAVPYLVNAVDLYRGEFLASFFVGDSIAFSEWASLRRERYHRQVIEAQYQLARHYERCRDYERARHYAQRQVELEPWREEAHRQLMRMLARSGQRSAALAQYKRCCQTLVEELGVEPQEETVALYERIRASHSARPHNLPEQLTSFVGRQVQLSQIAERLEDPNCRLLTLVGPGGMGKTRLALQAATEALVAFLHGVYFVPLAAVEASEILAFSVADALSFQLHGSRDPLDQLLEYLREKELLLVLDGFEHLNQDAEVLTEILKGAPHVKILVTSRERLNLRVEWLLTVDGLAYPENNVASGVQSYGAIQLFLQNAGRVCEGFALSERNLPCVLRICRLLEGAPLGIELASAWVRALSCEQIAAEIQRDLDFLSTSLRDVPDRHRSMRVVFDHSYRRLSGVEKEVFCKLSVFRGGFRQKAAEKVTGASPSILVALLDKSLLRQTARGRYDMHELLRQYAVEKLHEFPNVEEGVQDLHSAYYADFVFQSDRRLHGREQKVVLEKLGAEIDNLRSGWAWAVERVDEVRIGRYLDAVYHFYTIHGWFREGESLFAQAAARLSARPATEETVLGRLLARQARFSFHLGHYERAGELYQRGLSISRRLGDMENVAFSLLNLGFVHYVQGEHVEATRLYQESFTIYETLDDLSGVAFCLLNLGNSARAGGELMEARRLYQECLAIRRQIGDLYGVAIALNNLGNVAEALGTYTEAQQLYRECLTSCREIGYQSGIAASLTNLGYVAWKLRNCTEARRLYQEGLDIKKRLGDRRSIALSLINLGEVNCTLGEYQESRQHFKRALRMAAALQLTPLVIEALVGMATLLSAVGEKQKALELSVLVLQHAVNGKGPHDRAERLIAELVSKVPEDVVVTTRTKGKANSLEEMVDDMLNLPQSLFLREVQ